MNKTHILKETKVTMKTISSSSPTLHRVLWSKRKKAREEDKAGHAATPARKSVTFCTTAELRLTISRRNYSPEEIEACWYSKAEYTKINRSAIKVIKKINQGSTSSPRGEKRKKKSCLRGLEGQTIQGLANKVENRCRSINSVLMEQDSPWASHISGDEGIAFVYGLTTLPCRLSANVIGLRDEKVVQKYLKPSDWCEYLQDQQDSKNEPSQHALKESTSTHNQPVRKRMGRKKSVSGIKTHRRPSRRKTDSDGASSRPVTSAAA